MRLMIVVLNLVEALAGNSKIVRQIVVAGGDDKLACAKLQHSAKAIHGVNDEVAIAAVDALDVFILANVQAVVLRNFAVVLQGFIPIGFLIWTGEGHVADLKQFRRCEKRHVGRVVKERIAKAAFIDKKSGKS